MTKYKIFMPEDVDSGVVVDFVVVEEVEVGEEDVEVVEVTEEVTEEVAEEVAEVGECVEATEDVEATEVVEEATEDG